MPNFFTPLSHRVILPLPSIWGLQQQSMALRLLRRPRQHLPPTPQRLLRMRKVDRAAVWMMATRYGRVHTYSLSRSFWLEFAYARHRCMAQSQSGMPWNWFQIMSSQPIKIICYFKSSQWTRNRDSALIPIIAFSVNTGGGGCEFAPNAPA